ncbi:MAG: hypothetical protein K9M98_10590 [Cephaloticoccus sp.]|nr:hypothetical protein [Cephaloticoccus sp.]MCF7760938.1 hypothetical protein [Cephaloticoccus sp.]
MITLQSTMIRLGLVAALSATVALRAQPSFEGPPPSRVVVQDNAQRREAYLARIKEVYDYRIGQADPKTLDMAVISMLLMRGEQIEACNRRVLEMMGPGEVGTGPFWMFPSVFVAFTGQGKLSPEAMGSIREAWRTERQLRGDTENHWVMYHTSLYLMSELYPHEPGNTWYTGNSSEENLQEARGWLVDWMNITTTIGQGEYDPTHYIGEYAIPMLMLATWAKDPEMRQRGHMMLDWIFAELSNATLQGVLRGPNSRTDDTSVLERWNSLASFFSWLQFGNTPPTAGYGGWGNYFAVIGASYELPEVIYRIAVDRQPDALQHDQARTRRIWRYSDEHMPPIYKTQYIRRDYAVGSHQGRISDPIQSHVWDVTWAENDPRGKQPTMFSVHPHSSGRVMQMFFASYPEPMPISVSAEGKPSYDTPDKLVGCSPYEKVFQDLDTVVALYDIAPGERFPQVNGFFSKDLQDLTEDESGWIFARGGKAYLAYRPLAGYTWIPHLTYRQLPSTEGYKWARDPSGSKVLVSPHLKNGTIVQAASVSEFADFAAFQAAIKALPLTYSLEPEPTVKMTTLRGKKIVVTYGQAPVVNGEALDYSKWKLFEGPNLNAEIGARKLTITHGRLQRVLDFNTLTIADTVTR